MPGAMPARPAFSFAAKTFSSGGFPSKMATARARNSGSARNTAATGKFGTKMQANMKQYLVPSTQLSVPSQVSSGNWVLATAFSSRPGSLAGERDLGRTNRFAIQPGAHQLRRDFQFSQQLRVRGQ